jgi:23S rRNA pseudouridine1911/1915/1917 synthase
VDAVLAELTEGALSRTAVQRLIRAGEVRLDGRTARSADQVSGGEALEYSMPVVAPSPLEAEQVHLRVVYEDGHLAVIDKDAGMVVHPGPGHSSGTLVHALLGRGARWSAVGGAERPGIVHRLDRWTSGLLVVARDDETHRALARQLAARTMSRTYIALVDGAPPSPAAVVDAPIGRDPRNRQRMAVVVAGRPARTQFHVLQHMRRHSLVELTLETGRTHQVRVHLASIGCPVTGDAVYGRRSGLIARPALHAARLAFTHPHTEAGLSFESTLPHDMNAAISAAGAGH